MKRSDVVRSIKVQFNRMRTSDAMAMLDCVVDEIKTAVAKIV